MVARLNRVRRASSPTDKPSASRSSTSAFAKRSDSSLLPTRPTPAFTATVEARLRLDGGPRPGFRGGGRCRAQQGRMWKTGVQDAVPVPLATWDQRSLPSLL